MNETPQRKRWRVVLLLGAVTLAAAAFFGWPGGPKEPVYQGKSLTQWIDDSVDIGIFEQPDDLKAAMTAMGTNAIPYLVHEFTRPTSRWRERVCAWAKEHPSFKIRLQSEEQRVDTAGRGLLLLETNAAPALPELARHLGDPKRDAYLRWIFEEQGEAAVPHLTTRIGSTNPAVVRTVLLTLARLAHGSETAREAAAAALVHSSPTMRAAAVPTLAVTRNPGKELVTRLVALASDPSPLVRQAATNELAKLGADTSHPSRTAASEALRQLQADRVR